MNNKISLTAIVLTYNEEIHLNRCLSSLQGICSDIVVVDSFSKDRTQVIANQYNARFFQNPWVNHAHQLNWAIANTNITTDWVIRVDADEFLDEELQQNIVQHLPSLPGSTIGLRVKRLMYFFNEPLKRGGMYPIWHLKIWRSGSVICEQRWMDERMLPIISGDIKKLEGNLIDNNLNNISWWTQKHNGYATREAIDILDQLFGFTKTKVEQADFFGTPEKRRRWMKMRYLKLPLFVRPFAFFIIRYIFQLGFLEGKRGFVWSFLQCFWYRFLVDVKIFEVYRKCGKDKERIITYFKEEFNYDVTNPGAVN